MDALDSAPAGESGSETFRFRPMVFWSRSFLWQLAGVPLGIAISAAGASAQRLVDRGYLATLLGVLLAICGALILRRLRLRRAGGIPPITLGPDGLTAPRSMRTSRLAAIPYPDILSVTVAGKGRRARLLLDTRRRTFVFPVREFADTSRDTVAAIASGLARRIVALPGGALQAQAMAGRAAAAVRFRKTRPIVTWSSLAAVALVYAVQTVVQASGDAWATLDLGANAALLVLRGEWYRLVTANLLHASMLHLLSNALFALVIGSIAERIIGWRRFALLILVAGIASQAASAGDALWRARFVFSLGASGALMGVLGALAVLQRRFAGQLPGGYRFAARSWWLLLGLNFGLIPLLVPQVDNAAHLGGFAAGAVLGWLSCRRQSDIAAPPAASALVDCALAIAGALWLSAINGAIGHAVDPTLRRADQVALVADAAAFNGLSPDTDNALAWSIATDPKATPTALDDALSLAQRAVDAAAKDPRVKGRVQNGFTDTLATVHHRLGHDETALVLEETLLAAHDAFIDAQFSRFLDRYERRYGAPSIDGQPTGSGAGSVLALRWTAAGDVALELTRPAPYGIEIFALVRREGALLGSLRLALPRGRALSQTSTLPRELSAAYQAAPGRIELAVARVDINTCHCAEPNGVLRFLPLTKDVAELP